MKTTLRLLLAMSLLSLLLGCQTRTAQGGLAIGPLLDRIVPADFRGDGEFAERGQYLTIEVKAADLRRTDSGQWSWSSLEYRRTLNIPVFSGVPYRHEGWIRLGAPNLLPK